MHTMAGGSRRGQLGAVPLGAEVTVSPSSNLPANSVNPEVVQQESSAPTVSQLMPTGAANATTASLRSAVASPSELRAAGGVTAVPRTLSSTVSSAQTASRTSPGTSLGVGSSLPSRFVDVSSANLHGVQLPTTSCAQLPTVQWPENSRPRPGAVSPTDAELLLKALGQKPDPRKIETTGLESGKSHLRIPTSSTVWSGPVPSETVTKHYVTSSSPSHSPAPRCTTTVSRSYIVNGDRTYCADLTPVRLLPMREVDHFTAVCTVPGPAYDLRQNVDLLSPARRRRRRKMRGCGDCAFCHDCAIPVMDTVVGCLSSILLNGEDTNGPLLPGDGGSYYPAGYYSMLQGPSAPVETFCMDCGGIFRGDKLERRLFADMLAKSELSTHSAEKKRTDDEEAGKIPLPTFGDAPPHSPEWTKGRKTGGNYDSLFEWKGRDSAHKQGNQGNEFAYPKDDSGRVALPAFKLEEKDKGMRGVHKKM
ncbi:hypothetical protein TGME49_230850 [Toxoplasma gondii ME49]|uniref:Mucin, putative n=3 Tax=Toxoplasma gondii TaxID=5811 RepID=B6KJG3_TOXGV|nr:hypothetical protein TGME49_230850 [Toxoplasma gondii ME49]EPT28991.1 hypothetical protein TGME49_230850 [Toxoplasma gondii ME49]ESS35615.1 putative mucin [Toxoplasma gondii VEG]KYF46051.1 putative mucin [Toxoplasma gondii ARI]CEL74800.1 TPA: mucin, putative [Toxoplasma gondii VEG]|eukprot:XP_002367986.1 hypothetical protein TGME49_230850 [Toxoplasma gondii ME49]